MLHDDTASNEIHIKIFFVFTMFIFTTAAWMAINYLMLHFSENLTLDGRSGSASSHSTITESASEGIILATSTTVEYSNRAAMKMVLHSQ